MLDPNSSPLKKEADEVQPTSYDLASLPVTFSLYFGPGHSSETLSLPSEFDYGNSIPPNPPAIKAVSCQYNPQEVVRRLKLVFADLQQEVVGCTDLLRQTIYALLCRENQLLISPPGTAKSMYAQLLFSRIKDAQIFEAQMTKGTLTEEVIGPVIVEEMRHGRIRHNVQNTLVDADLAFVDEFFDANDMVLRSMLGIYNERWFKKGSERIQAALHTGIAAANYVRANEMTAAVIDRFLFRAHLDAHYDPFIMQAIDQAYAKNFGQVPETTKCQAIPLDQIAYLADIIYGRDPERIIKVPEHILFLKNALIFKYMELMDGVLEAEHRKPMYISPRTSAKCRLILSASALLRGRDTVSTDDLRELRYAITTIGQDGPQAHCFQHAFDQALRLYSAADLEAVDQLAEARLLAHQVVKGFQRGEPAQPRSFLQRLMLLCKLTSPGQVRLSHIWDALAQIEPSQPLVSQFKDGLVKELQQLQLQINADEPGILF